MELWTTEIDRFLDTGDEQLSDITLWQVLTAFYFRCIHLPDRGGSELTADSIWTYPFLTDAELAPYQVEEKTVQKYSLETYDVNAFTRILFESLDKRIMNLSPAVKKEYKKLYVAYKLDANFVDIVFQKQRLRISINMRFSEINDPNGICKDITGLGRWGNGDVELFMENQDCQAIF